MQFLKTIFSLRLVGSKDTLWAFICYLWRLRHPALALGAGREGKVTARKLEELCADILGICSPFLGRTVDSRQGPKNWKMSGFAPQVPSVMERNGCVWGEYKWGMCLKQLNKATSHSPAYNRQQRKRAVQRSSFQGFLPQIGETWLLCACQYLTISPT